MNGKRSKSIEKKKNISVKKCKHKKYEKPSERKVKFYQCTQCPKVFKRSSNFKAHQRTHNPLTARPFSCQVITYKLLQLFPQYNLLDKVIVVVI